jgi:hypothetical protein
MAKFAEFHAERDLEIKRKQIVAEAEAANRPEPAALLKAKEVATEISRWRVGSMGESGAVYTGSIKAETITELLFSLKEIEAAMEDDNDGK